MLDYIFTRLYCFHEKREKGGNSVFSSSIYVSALRLLFIYSGVTMLGIFSGGKLTFSNLHFDKTFGKVLFVLAFIIMMFLDYKRYKNKYQKLLDMYKNRPCNNWFKIWMVGALIMILFLSPILWNELYKLLC